MSAAPPTEEQNLSPRLTPPILELAVPPLGSDRRRAGNRQDSQSKPQGGRQPQGFWNKRAVRPELRLRGGRVRLCPGSGSELGSNRWGLKVERTHLVPDSMQGGLYSRRRRWWFRLWWW